MKVSKLKSRGIQQIISDLDIVKKVIDYHYDIESEALKTNDIYDGTMTEYIAEELAQYDGDALEYKWYEQTAKRIMDEVADDVAEEICDRDNDAMEYENERREAMKGNY